MQLRDFIKGMTKDQLESFATACATTVGQIKQVAYAKRRAGEGLSINIERESNRAVTCEELRPDVDWAYLRGTPAPKAAAMEGGKHRISAPAI
ncbi:helix-turn-helix domain-containing protein [Pseudomonas sp. BN414]|uniref:YdaS family helix-turn-helix protein n=1 Tax=Pseudomonas sp. BN414 TaxID=2567888 RepID=UPI002453C87E|nr:YdaS family helix-turn-helix protein [Pseudomonas sp. BN414]MDH4566154.1 helix-turn-helix domain-containing protein [Pseudomonas sp. BN414]